MTAARTPVATVVATVVATGRGRDGGRRCAGSRARRSRRHQHGRGRERASRQPGRHFGLAARRPGRGGPARSCVIFGSRSLLGHPLPAVAQLPNLSIGWSGLWRSWWSTWQTTGLGVTAPSSPALALLGVLATVLFGAVGTLQHVVVLGPLLIGPLGAYRAARWWGSRRGRLAALIAYAVVPLPYNALARGHWQGLVAYAALPWVLAAIGRLSGELPFPVTRPERTGGRTIGLGLLVAVAAAAVPSLLYVVPLVGVALLAGSALTGRVRPGLRMLVTAVGATVVAVVLLIPWSGAVLASRVATLGVGAGPTGRLGFGQVLRFDTGPVGPGVLGWALLVAAALPLFIGRGWRLAWATRLWVVAIAFFWLTWAGATRVDPGAAGRGRPGAGRRRPGRLGGAGRGGLRAGSARIPVRMASAGRGPGRSGAGCGGDPDAHRVGPGSLAPAERRRHAPCWPSSPTQASGSYRVLWVGAPDALPLAARSLDSGIGFATSYNGEPDVTDQWITARQGATPALATDLRLVQNRLTTKFGHLLAPMAVRYVVVPNHNGPAGSGAAAVLTPGALLAGLRLQTDLQLVNVDPNYTVYQNAAWAPGRAVLPPAALPVAAGGATATRELQQTDLTGAAPVLDQGGPTRAQGPVPAGSVVYVAATRQGGWRLHVGTTSIPPQPAFGWAMSFAVPGRFERAGDVGAHPVMGAAGGSAGRDPALGCGHRGGRSRPASTPGGVSAHGDRPSRVVRPDEPGRDPVRTATRRRRRAPSAPRTSRATRCGSMSDPPVSGEGGRPLHRSGGAARAPIVAGLAALLIIGGLIDRAPGSAPPSEAASVQSVPSRSRWRRRPRRCPRRGSARERPTLMVAGGRSTAWHRVPS